MMLPGTSVPSGGTTQGNSAKYNAMAVFITFSYGSRRVISEFCGSAIASLSIVVTLHNYHSSYSFLLPSNSCRSTLWLLTHLVVVSAFGQQSERHTHYPPKYHACKSEKSSRRRPSSEKVRRTGVDVLHNNSTGMIVMTSSP